MTPQEYAKQLERLANQKVWMPAQIHDDGTISNAKQVYVKVTGAEKGESNFKKMQKPTKHGYKSGCDLGTYVMNIHVKYEDVTPLAGDQKNTIVDGARLVRLGGYVKRSKLTPQNRIFDEAARRAAEIISNPSFIGNKNSTAQTTSTEAESKRIFVA